MNNDKSVEETCTECGCKGSHAIGCALASAADYKVWAAAITAAQSQAETEVESAEKFVLSLKPDAFCSRYYNEDETTRGHAIVDDGGAGPLLSEFFLEPLSEKKAW